MSGLCHQPHTSAPALRTLTAPTPGSCTLSLRLGAPAKGPAPLCRSSAQFPGESTLGQGVTRALTEACAGALQRRKGLHWHQRHRQQR